MRILKWGCGTLLGLLTLLVVLAVILGPAHLRPTSRSGSGKKAPTPSSAEDIGTGDREVSARSPHKIEIAQEEAPQLGSESSQASQERTIVAQIDPHSDIPEGEAERLKEVDQYPDLFIVLSRASVGEQDLDALNGSYVQGNEAFQVASVLDGFVIYQLRPDLQSLDQRRSVALMRDPRKSYVTGDLMPRDIYTLRGTKEFATVFGVHEMIPIVERGKR